MPVASCLSELGSTMDAVRVAAASIVKDLNGLAPDLTFLFVSHHHREHFEKLAGWVQEQLPSRVLLGCAAESVAGRGVEIEGTPALSLWSAVLPEATLVPFHLEFERTPDGMVSDGWPAELAAGESQPNAVFLLGEPFSTAINVVIDQLSDDHAAVPLIGGMASGGREPGDNCLFLGGTAVERGAVGVAVFGGPQIETVVSQGCRPVGPTFVVTKARDNLVMELGGKPALQQLGEFYTDLAKHDQLLVQRGLHLGIVMNEYQETFEVGDFLISNVMGADHDKGVIQIGNRVRVGQTVRFHVRDADTADEELTSLLLRCRYGKALPGSEDVEPLAEPADIPLPAGALLFSCNGRGSRLFPELNHDAAAIDRLLGHVPLAGFFAQGELGPVSGRNYIHGYTASIAVFRDC